MKVGYGTKLKEFADAIARIKTKEILLESVQESSELALDLNRQQLIAESVDSKGKKLGVYSSSNKKKFGPIDLLDTGAFQEGMFVNSTKLPIFIDSKDNKTGILEVRYGPVLGLTAQNEKDYASEVKKIYVKKVHAVIDDLKEKILL